MYMVRAYHMLEDTAREEKAAAKYHKLFPLPEDKIQLQQLVDGGMYMYMLINYMAYIHVYMTYIYSTCIYMYVVLVNCMYM